jgi:hypothetical protein
MKKNKVVWIFVLLLLVSLLAIGAFQSAFIKGIVQPANVVTNVWAVSGKDTFSGSILQNDFEISKLRRGVYTIVIEAEPPYKKQFAKTLKSVIDR